MQTIRAARALLPDGWAENVEITLEAGRIAAVRRGVPGGAGALVPAPVNLHSHGFQRAMAGLTERRTAGRDSFWTWRDLMYRFLDRLTPEDVEAVTAFAQLEMLEAGFGAVAEFHYLHHRTDGGAYDDPAEMSARICAAAEATGIGLTLLPVLYMQGGCDRRALGPGQRRFGCGPEGFMALREAAGAHLATLPDGVLGAAPHSLRAVPPEVVSSLAEGTAGPLHMHIAEQLAEVEEVEAAHGARPVALFLDRIGASDRWCLVHATQMSPAETRALAESGVVAGLCPITEANLGDGIFDGVRFLEHGGRIGIGSDSNVRITLTGELRQLDYSQRLRDRTRAALAVEGGSTGARLFAAVLEGGALAAGRASGAIEAGRAADLLRLDDTAPDVAALSPEHLADAWVFAAGDRLVQDVWAGGRHVVREGRHVARDRIASRYAATLARLVEAL